MAENVRHFDDSENQQNDNKPNLSCENNNVEIENVCLNTDLILDSINIGDNVEIQEEIVSTNAEEEVKIVQVNTKQGDKCAENHLVIVDTCGNDESKQSIGKDQNAETVKGLVKGTVLTTFYIDVSPCFKFLLCYFVNRSIDNGWLSP